MSSPVSELVAQRDALERKIRALESAAKAEAISAVRELMEEYGLTVADLATKTSARSTPKSSAATRRKVAAKFRDPVIGVTWWSGRGLKPRWLSAALGDGKKIEDFAI